MARIQNAQPIMLPRDKTPARKDGDDDASETLRRIERRQKLIERLGDKLCGNEDDIDPKEIEKIVEEIEREAAAAEARQRGPQRRH